MSKRDERDAAGRARDADGSGTEAQSSRTPVTEQVNPGTTDLDRIPTAVILERIVTEDAGVAAAVRAAIPDLERATDLLVSVLLEDGRWINIGAGTSGRLGVLDAAELPPTFGLEPDRVVGLVAGGPPALKRSVEGAEDDGAAARAALRECGLCSCDALLAISASGRTPYTLAALERAREVGAQSIALTCDPDSPMPALADVGLVVEVGPEVIAGSTRMKAGVAQKMALHALSTAVMVRMGRVRGNLMSEMRAVNAKLRRRGIRIVARLARVPESEAAQALAAAQGSVPEALEQLGVPRRGYATRS